MTNTTTPAAECHSFEIESIEIGTNRRLAFRAFARINGKRFEFARLASGTQVEVYDFPAAWGGVSRFVGYAPTAQGEMVESIARKHVGGAL